MSRRVLAPVSAVVFIDLLGFSVILPLLPNSAERLGASAFEVGLRPVPIPVESSGRVRR